MTAHSYDAVRKSPFYRARARGVPRRPCANSCSARSSPTPTPGTKRANSRASFTRRPPRSATWGSAFPKRYGGTRRRPLHAHHRHAGGRARRLRRRRRRPVQPHHRRAADPVSRFGGDEGARAAADSFGREDLGARHNRTLRRLRRRQSAGRPRAATAIISSSTAPRPSSPQACARTSSRWPCAPAAPGRAASACS